MLTVQEPHEASQSKVPALFASGFATYGAEMQDVVLDEQDPFAALAAADGLVNARDFEKAIATIQPALDKMPENYWVNLIHARTLSGLGRSDEATRAFERSAFSDDPSRIGGIYELMMIRFREGNFSDAHLIDEALTLAEGNDQKKWYFSQLLFLKALDLLRAGALDRSDDHLRQAYDHRLHFGDERQFAFDWVNRALAGRDVSQHGYLKYLKRLLRASRDPATYDGLLAQLPPSCRALEIGAMDGIRFDPLRPFIVSRNWEAVLLEPLPDMFDALQQNYKGFEKVRCYNLAISDKEGSTSIFRITPKKAQEEGHADWVVGSSSMSKSFVLSMNEQLVTEQTIHCMPFKKFAEQARIETFDVLQIDTEGHDWIVLQQIDLTKRQVKIVSVEIVHLSVPDRFRVLEFLDGHQFSVAFNGGDLIAYKGLA